MRDFAGPLVAVLFGLTALAAPAAATDKVQVVHFKAGASSATVKGQIKGWDMITYRLEARAGQVMSVLFSPSLNACYFNVTPPGGGNAIHVGADGGNEFAESLPASGVYGVEVYMMRSEARRGKTCNYRITFEIGG